MTTTTARPAVLSMEQVYAPLEEALASHYELYKWWEIEDKDDFLAHQGQKIRGIVTTGGFGANRTLIESLPALEVIADFGVGFDAIDLDAAREHNVAVSNTPQVLNECVADTALALLLSLSRRIVKGDGFIRAGKWPSGGFELGHKVTGKRIGIVGLGRIGRKIAQRAAGFDMQIGYTDVTPSDTAPESYTFYSELSTLASASDYLVLALPGGASTHHLVDAAILEALGKDSFLINVARGSIVDEQALIEALKSNGIAGAGLDVFEHEPNVPQALIDDERVVLTPHLASATVETRDAMTALVLDNLASWFSQQTLKTAVV